MTDDQPTSTLRRIEFDPTFEAWRKISRRLIAEAVPPSAVDWQPRGETTQLALLDAVGSTGGPLSPTGTRTTGSTINGSAVPSVPRSFLAKAQQVARHRDASRWSLLYRVLWRLLHGEPQLMKIIVDDDVFRLQRMAKSVSRDQHKMKAFVRFRRVENEAGEVWFIAWHRPDHHIVEAVAPFFVERFNDQRWTILTPDISASWDLNELRFGQGVPRGETAPAKDELEDLWRTYYASIFNPARVKVKAMKAELPVRHWATLPEASLIPELLLDARRRVDAMVAKPVRPPAREAFPQSPSLASLGGALRQCRACALCENGTAPVPGEGPDLASTVLIGEQPGDVEEQLGRPFVGPAGAILDRALEAAGLDRQQLYLTNTVKHFKFKQKGKRRIHQSPGLIEVSSCWPWLREELSLLRPQIVVGLGATAARALLGGEVRLRRDRGQPRPTAYAPWTMVTYHPSAILRIPDPAARRKVEEAFFADLQRVAERFRSLPSMRAEPPV